MGRKVKNIPQVSKAPYLEVFKKDFIYLIMRETERGRDTGIIMRDTERGRDTSREEEAGSAGEPDARLDAMTPGSRPEWKADAQPLSHPGAPNLKF